MPDLSVTEESRNRDNLFAGDFPVVTESVVISSGQDLARGAVLGKVTASGEYILSLSAAGDGSQTPKAVLAEAVDATGGAKTATIYRTGMFNERALTFGTGHSASTQATIDALEAENIYMRDSLAA